MPITTGNFPTLKFGSKYYEIGQILDKSLYARKPVVRSDFNGTTTTKVSIAKGNYVGKIYSWVESGGKLQLMLYGQYPYGNFVDYDPYAFSEDALTAQGALTLEEEAALKAEADKSIFDKIFDGLGLTNIGKTLSWGLPLFAVGYLGIKLYGEKNKADNLKRITDESK